MEEKRGGTLWSSPLIISPRVVCPFIVFPLPTRRSELCPPDLWAGTSSNICAKPELRLLVLPVEPRLLPAPLGPPSLPFFDLNLCCFFFNPWRRPMMMSRIWGRNRSRLAGLASWLRVSSRIVRRSSGTGPRSAVSTPILLKARHAMLNSYPRRT